MPSKKEKLLPPFSGCVPADTAQGTQPSSLPGSCWLRFNQVCPTTCPCFTELLPARQSQSASCWVSVLDTEQGRCPDWISWSLLSAHFSCLAPSECSPALEHTSCIPSPPPCLYPTGLCKLDEDNSVSPRPRPGPLNKAPCNHLQTLACNFLPSILNYKLKLLQILHKKLLDSKSVQTRCFQQTCCKMV